MRQLFLVPHGLAPGMSYVNRHSSTHCVLDPRTIVSEDNENLDNKETKPGSSRRSCEADNEVTSPAY